MKEIYSTLPDFKNEIKAVTTLLRGNGVKYRSREYGPWFKIYVIPQSVEKANRLIRNARKAADRRK